MKNYKRTLLLASIVISLPSGFLIWVGIVTSSVSHLVFWGGMLGLWWGTYFCVQYDKRFSFWGSFLLVNLFWWPILGKTILRIIFVVENGGMERADGYGSPVAFLIGLVGEQLFFIPLSLAMIAGILAMIRPTSQGSA